MTSTAAPRTEFTTPSDTDIVAVRSFAAPRAKVWAAYTRPEPAAPTGRTADRSAPAPRPAPRPSPQPRPR